MSNTIKVIDLLNKIANGEKFPKIIKIDYITYKWNKSENKYCRQDADYVSLSFDTNTLNDEVEIIEEQEEIDIQQLIELENYKDTEYYDCRDIQTNRRMINKLVQAVKQLDKKIKEKQWN